MALRQILFNFITPLLSPKILCRRVAAPVLVFGPSSSPALPRIRNCVCTRVVMTPRLGWPITWAANKKCVYVCLKSFRNNSIFVVRGRRRIYAQLRVPSSQHETRKNLVKLPGQWQRKFKCPFGEPRTLPPLPLLFFAAAATGRRPLSLSVGWRFSASLHGDNNFAYPSATLCLLICTRRRGSAWEEEEEEENAVTPVKITNSNCSCSCLYRFGARALLHFGAAVVVEEDDENEDGAETTTKTALDQLVLS